MTHSWARWTVVAATSTVAAFWAAGTVGAGPVPEAGAGFCMPWPANGMATVGHWIPNNGPAPITITHVALREPAGMSVIDTSLMASHQEPGGGSSGMDFGAYPPSFGPDDGSPELADEWDARVEAVGAQVPPRDGRALIIAVQRPSANSPPATLKGFDITYVDAGVTHHASMEWDIMLATDVSDCEVWADRP
jgi:hypothetical protein